MKLNLGYRAMLSVEQDAYEKLFSEVPCPDSVRVGTWTICMVCGEPYIKHPYVIPHYFLNVLCDGRVVKL
jgi:hypothetical protein